MNDLENIVTNIANEWDVSKCWFCKSGTARQDTEYSLDLYRVIEYEKTYVVIGFSHKQKYETTKIVIPRCSNCKAIHGTTFWILFVLWLILFSVVAVIAVKIWLSENQPWFINLIGGIIGLILLGAVCALAIAAFGTALRFFTNLFWKSESYAMKSPRVKSLIEQGWKEGASPSYKQGV
jgi:amino acid transporter